MDDLKNPAFNANTDGMSTPSTYQADSEENKQDVISVRNSLVSSPGYAENSTHPTAMSKQEVEEKQSDSRLGIDVIKHAVLINGNQLAGHHGNKTEISYRPGLAEKLYVVNLDSGTNALLVSTQSTHVPKQKVVAQPVESLVSHAHVQEIPMYDATTLQPGAERSMATVACQTIESTVLAPAMFNSAKLTRNVSLQTEEDIRMYEPTTLQPAAERNMATVACQTIESTVLAPAMFNSSKVTRTVSLQTEEEIPVASTSHKAQVIDKAESHREMSEKLVQTSFEALRNMEDKYIQTNKESFDNLAVINLPFDSDPALPSPKPEIRDVQDSTTQTVILHEEPQIKRSLTMCYNCYCSPVGVLESSESSDTSPEFLPAHSPSRSSRRKKICIPAVCQDSYTISQTRNPNIMSTSAKSYKFPPKKYLTHQATDDERYLCIKFPYKKARNQHAKRRGSSMDPCVFRAVVNRQRELQRDASRATLQTFGMLGETRSFPVYRRSCCCHFKDADDVVFQRSPMSSCESGIDLQEAWADGNSYLYDHDDTAITYLCCGPRPHRSNYF